MQITGLLETFNETRPTEEALLFAHEDFSDRMHTLSNWLDVLLEQDPTAPSFQPYSLSERCERISDTLNNIDKYIQTFSSAIHQYSQVQYKEPLATFTKDLIQEVRNFINQPEIKNLPEAKNIEEKLKQLESHRPEDSGPAPHI